MNKIEVVSKEIINNSVLNADILSDNNVLTINLNGINEDNIILINNVYENIVINFNEDSVINLFEIKKNNISTDYKYILLDNSKVIINTFYCGDKVNDIYNIDLLGHSSDITLNLSAISNNEQVYNISVNHLNKNTTSNVFTRGVTLENGKIDFIVNGLIKKGMINSSLNQDNKIMTLGESKSIIKPNLYIDENMVNAKHGASIGKFNDDEIFYLESRGIPSIVGYKILSKGFLLSKLLIRDSIKEEIEDILNNF